ncbi:hypothetical protein ACIBI9_57050 [Nonomuraea sp. NPDC050451]|uniref:hypothetical protein n=1 Tax=Nonomuraea sp. NPDC050451 TaxID=3364364 RepID=UPI0037B7C000
MYDIPRRAVLAGLPVTAMVAALTATPAQADDSYRPRPGMPREIRMTWFGITNWHYQIGDVGYPSRTPNPSLSASEREALRERAMVEARAVAGLHHPGIVPVHDVLEEDGRPWIVMHLVEGRSLDEEVAASGSLGPPGD